MTAEQAEEIMMLVEDYGTYRYGQGRAKTEHTTESYAEAASGVWDKIWAALKDHVSEGD